MDKDEQIEDVDPMKEPKGLKLTAIPDRREGVLKSIAESVIFSFTNDRVCAISPFHT